MSAIIGQKSAGLSHKLVTLAVAGGGLGANESATPSNPLTLSLSLKGRGDAVAPAIKFLNQGKTAAQFEGRSGGVPSPR
jgi:hypothetical protein